VVIPVEDAYGEPDPSKITTINLTETVPVQKTMTKAAFYSYYGSEPVGFSTYLDPIYHWDAYVVFVDSSNVIVRNNVPSGGATYRAYGSSDPAYGWDMTASYDESGQNITVHHLLDASSGGKVKGYDGSTRLIVKSVDEAAGTATVDRNNEVVGKELTFIVTVVGKN
jgi:FKBP-type peptidyl-prolyl cis-trans isomerase 2